MKYTRKFLRQCGTHGCRYLETITERGLSNLGLENRVLYQRQSEWHSQVEKRQKQVYMLYAYVRQALILV